MAFIYKIYSFFTWCMGLVLPFFSRASSYRMLGPFLRWTLHVLLMAGILFGLWYINKSSGLENLLLNTRLHHLKQFWLPILFLILYALSWMGWWVWSLLAAEPEDTAFPDIDQAFEECSQALAQAGLGWSDAPLFLILGKPLGGVEALLNAAQLSFQVKSVPRRADSPIRMFANRDGIYLACTDACILGKQADILAGNESLASSVNMAESGEGSNDELFKTMAPRGQAKEVIDILADAREAGRSPTQLTEDEQQEIKLRARRQHGSLLKNREMVDRCSARLKHLCRLISRERQPYCPVNGIMFLLNYFATDTEEDTNDTSLVCQRDLATCRKYLSMDCPVIAMVVDLEQMPGFLEFINRFPDDQRQRRVGQRFPLTPDVGSPSEASEQMQEAVKWICSSLVPTWVYKLFDNETMPGRTLDSAVKGNVRLYRMMSQMRLRGRRMSKIISRAVGHEQGEPMMFGGCYLGGTGRDSTMQAFIPGVFRRLIEEQDNVTWTTQARAENDAYLRWTTTGYILIALLILSVIGLVVLTYMKT